MVDPPVGCGIAFAAFVVVGAVSISVADAFRLRRRTAELRRWSMQHGYDFRPDAIPAAELAPMQRLKSGGRVPMARNIVQRSGVTAFDFYRREGSGRSVRKLRSTCALFALDRPLPAFSFAAHTASPTLDDVLSMARELANPPLLEIDGRPGFFVRAENLQPVAPLFAGERARWFDDKVGWSVDAEGRWLLVTAPPGAFGPALRWLPLPFVAAESYERFLATSEAIRDRFTREPD